MYGGGEVARSFESEDVVMLLSIFRWFSAVSDNFILLEIIRLSVIETNQDRCSHDQDNQDK